ncbi:hypothetical protein AOLI_G00264890, partial [Acnodon oligacanthus]
SFSELYQKSIQDAESKSGEGQSGEAWVLDEREVQEEQQEQEEIKELEEEEREQGEGEESVSMTRLDGREAETEEEESGEAGLGGSTCLLSPPSLPLLRAASLQDSPLSQGLEVTPSALTRSYSLERHPPYQDIFDGHVYDNVGLKVNKHIYENPGELKDATPDLILAVKPKVPLEEEGQIGVDEGGEERPSGSDVLLRSACMERAERNSRALSLHNSITKILSETTDSSEEEWQSISDLATACRSILEALSREDRKAGDGSQAAADTGTLLGQTDAKLKDIKDSDSPSHLEEKVSQLEAMLKRLQDDLQKGEQRR